MANATRDTNETMGYINPDPPPGAGILTVMNATAEQYKKARHLMINNYTVPFADARTTLPGGLGAWDLETHGFTVFEPPAPVDFFDRNLVRTEYYPRLIESVKKITGAKNGYAMNIFGTRDESSKGGNAYARFAHADAGPDSPPVWRNALVNRYGVSKEEANSCDLLMVNIWHPRDRPAYKDPLCLLDVSTVDVSTELAKIRYVNGKGETSEMYGNTTYVNKKGETVKRNASPEIAGLVGPTYSPKHRWVYISDQRPDEAWLFKQWDTRDDGRAKLAFHNSFHDPFYDQEPNTPGRRSAEFRLLLTFPKTETPTSKL